MRGASELEGQGFGRRWSHFRRVSFEIPRETRATASQRVVIPATPIQSSPLVTRLEMDRWIARFTRFEGSGIRTVGVSMTSGSKGDQGGDAFDRSFNTREFLIRVISKEMDVELSLHVCKGATNSLYIV